MPPLAPQSDIEPPKTPLVVAPRGKKGKIFASQDTMLTLAKVLDAQESATIKKKVDKQHERNALYKVRETKRAGRQAIKDEKLKSAKVQLQTLIREERKAKRRLTKPESARGPSARKGNDQGKLVRFAVGGDVDASGRD